MIHIFKQYWLHISDRDVFFNSCHHSLALGGNYSFSTPDFDASTRRFILARPQSHRAPAFATAPMCSAPRVCCRRSTRSPLGTVVTCEAIIASRIAKNICNHHLFFTTHQKFFESSICDIYSSRIPFRKNVNTLPQRLIVSAHHCLIRPL